MMVMCGNNINGSVIGTDREEAVFEVWKYWNGKDKAIKLYEEGIQLPAKFEWVKDIKTDIHGWKEFAEMQKISSTPPKALSTVTTGKKSLKELFINDVWYGKMTVEEATAEYTKTANEGIDKYYEQNKSANRDEDIKKIKARQPR